MMNSASAEIDAGKTVRNRWLACKNGARGKCPKCGRGRLFRGYLRISDTCDHCAEALHHHRADDAPPYITMAIVGHVIVGIIFHIESRYQLDPMIHLYWSLPAMVALSLALLRPVKGIVVAVQWANRLHGFGAKTDLQ